MADFFYNKFMNMTPREFYRQRHPRKFSDTKIVAKPVLSKPALESHLLNLTTRNEQDQFEKFVLHLCELEISPNLKPNTGPEGGGDGKTDAESYPVSVDLALGWAVGYETSGSDQLLAFAVSAKKKWQEKLRADLEKIQKTKKKFTRTYFITSQPVKADKRKDLEKELSKELGTDLHILDLTWIIGKAYTPRRIEMTVKELGIDVDVKDIVEVGPVDTFRQKRIETLDAKIEDAVSKGLVNHSIVSDAIDSAIYSREQEFDRHEVEGRLERAVRLADRYGTTNQRFMARYQKCWTAFWYFQDVDSLKKWYVDAQKHAIRAGGFDNIQKLSNLRNLLQNARNFDKKLITKKYLDDRTEALNNELRKLAGDKTAPSSSLAAEAALIEIDINRAFVNGEAIDGKLIELKEVVEKGEIYSVFPFEDISEFVTIIGDAIGDNEAYDSLFETVREIAQKRDGEKKSAKMVLERAQKLIDEGKYYKAIQQLGQALPDFQKKEMLPEASEALLCMGNCYEMVGLHWAARGSYLGAASIETGEFFKDDEPSPIQLAVYQAMIGIEIKLGRLPQVLQWYEIFRIFISILPDDKWNVDILLEKAMIYDLRLGGAFLTTPDIPKNTIHLIPVMEQLLLDSSSIALEHRLGRPDLWPVEFTDTLKPGEREEHFKNWAKQVPPDHVPKVIHLYEGEMINLLSHILGAEILITSPNNSLCIMTAESILATIESLLATAHLYHAVAAEPKITISLILDKSCQESELTYIANHEDLSITVNVPLFNGNSLAGVDQGKLMKSVLAVAAEITANVVVFKDAKESLEAIMLKERAFVRSVSFVTSYVRLGNVVGYDPKYRSIDWLRGIKEGLPEAGTPIDALPAGKEEPVEFKELEIKEVSHLQMESVSIIRLQLWNNAGWQGVGYTIAPGSPYPPIMGLIFKDANSGMKIFEKWREEYGENDEKDFIRVAVMRGISDEFPDDYRVGIGANPVALDLKNILVSSSTRINTMTPEKPGSLDMFIEQYELVGKFMLAPIVPDGDGGMVLRNDLGIIKGEVVIKQPKDLGDNDLDFILVGKSRQD
jgi:tetratricopeptide (TPR) repeat protein